MTALKMVLHVIAAVVAGIIPLLVDGTISPTEWVSSGTILLAALVLYVVPNLTEGPAKYAKAIVATGSAVAVLLTNFFADGSYGLTTSEWLQLLVAALGAVGVGAAVGPQWAGTVVSTRAINAAQRHVQEP